MLLTAVWGWYVRNRLWQESLRSDAAAAVDAAVARGLKLLPPAYGARLVAEGAIEGRTVRVEWRGGAFGTRSVVRGRRTWRGPLIVDAAALDAALAATVMSPSPSPPASPPP